MKPAASNGGRFLLKALHTKVSWLEGDFFVGLPGNKPVAVYDEIFPVTVTG